MMKKEMFKKSAKELQEYLMFKKRSSVVKSKKGKGSYDRKKLKKDLTND